MAQDRILITDLDGTIVGDGEALQRFRVWHAEVADELVLVYSSGRTFESIRGLARDQQLPAPQLAICSVGTEVRDWASGRELESWAERGRDFRVEEARHALRDELDLRLQPAEFQTSRKLSYYLPMAAPERLASLADRLASEGVRAELVYSSDRDLDVLPRGMHKGSAAHFVRAHYGASRQNTVVCGDSGNDLAMLKEGLCGVVVGNALPELRSLRAENVYHANAPYADGVLEGVQHWLEESAAR